MNRRGHVTVLAFVVSVGVIAGTAAAAGDRTAAHSTSQWLARQLEPDGTLENPNGGTLPDHGLMLDVLFSLHAAGDGALAAPIVNFLDDQGHATDYFTWDGLVPGSGFEAIIVGGAAAKVLVAAQVAGRNPRSFDGHDMVAETKAAIMRSGPDKGRVSDYTRNPDFADYVTNNANMFGQALGVIGLAVAGENDQPAVDKLVTQQCSEGYFRIFFGYVPTDETGDHVTPEGTKVSSCDEGKAFDQSAPDGDATGLALSALLAARKAGAPGLDAPIAQAVAWLKADQTASGGWGGGVGTEAANTNSTGVITQALAAAGGASSEVDRGVAFLRSAQANAASDSGNALAPHIGAIAYNPESYVAARTSGITGPDTWIRASAQASLGLSQVGFYELAKHEVPVATTTSAPVTTTTTPAVNTNRPAPKPAAPEVNKPTATPGASTPAAKLGAYLASRLVDGDHVEVTENGRTYVDYDATADLVLALRALGEQPEAVDRASKFLLTPDAIKAYAHGTAYEDGNAAYAEPLAKLVIVGEFQEDKADQLRADLVELRGDDGTFTDAGSFADNGTSVRRHAWAIMATAGDSGQAVARLVDGQCADGTFPEELGSGACESGDLAATAAAVLALNSGPRNDDGPTATAPDDWSGDRAEALVRAVSALNAKTNGKGVVTGEFDVGLTAVVAGARRFAGLDATRTAETLAGFVPADLATSLAAAPGVAGRSWASADGSPLSPVVRLPLSERKTEPTAQTTEPRRLSPWIYLLLITVLLATAFVLLRITKKGVAR